MEQIDSAMDTLFDEFENVEDLIRVTEIIAFGWQRAEPDSTDEQGFDAMLRRVERHADTIGGDDGKRLRAALHNLRQDGLSV